MSETILEVKDLRTYFYSEKNVIPAVDGVSFKVEKGKVLGIVGESGCGKSVTSMSILRLLPEKQAAIQPGSSIRFQGQELTTMEPKELRKIRGEKISMIFQDSMTSLNPTMTVGKQIMENLLTHTSMTKGEARKRAKELLELVEIPDPEERLDCYPHQLSGGMRQRVMIAIALACGPKLLIADEPTTALDVTIQAQLLDLLGRIREQSGMSVILVTHDLGVVASFAQRVQVMYAGQIVERGTVEDIFKRPRHPYTWALLSSIPGRALSSKSELYALQGTPPDLRLPLNGCPFADRCEYCMGICKKQCPQETQLEEGHSAACWLCHALAPKVQPPEGIGGKEE